MEQLTLISHALDLVQFPEKDDYIKHLLSDASDDVITKSAHAIEIHLSMDLSKSELLGLLAVDLFCYPWAYGLYAGKIERGELIIATE